MKSFRNSFLSNFYPAPVEDRTGKVWPTSEHAYQGAKTLDESERERVRSCATPAQAKRMGRAVTVRPDRDAVKLRLMT